MDIKIEKPSPEQLKAVTGWPVWEKEPCSFEMEYENEEVFYVIEGKAKIKALDGTDTEVEFNKGDLVTIPKGTRCRWEISEKIQKHYEFR